MRLLRAVAVVQERGVAAVRAQGDGGGKAVGATDAAGGGNVSVLLVGSEIDEVAGLASCAGRTAMCKARNRGQENYAGESDHGTSARFGLQEQNDEVGSA